MFPSSRMGCTCGAIGPAWATIGSIQVLATSLAPAALAAALWVPAPSQVAGVVWSVSLIAAVALVVPMYALAWWTALRRLRARRTLG